MGFDLCRMPGSQRAIHCYIIMSIWILMLVAGIYKFLEPKQNVFEPSVNRQLFQKLDVDIKTKRIFKICNLPQEMTDGDEGLLNSDDWELKGLLILLRHGDRGPLQHIRNISNVNCGTPETDLLASYKAYLYNLTLNGRLSSWIGPGPFHGFPLLPAHSHHCQLGQLTEQGISQLLELGQQLRYQYIDKRERSDGSSHASWSMLTRLVPTEVAASSTRYRRTFQSALAFLYGLLDKDTVSRLSIAESQSMSFCFKDCGCPIADKYARSFQNAINLELKSRPAVASLSATTGKMIFSSGAEQESLLKDPHAVRDALLTYVCHGSDLPCRTPFDCIRRHNVVGIFLYTDWIMHQKWKNTNWRRYCMLKSYGFVKHLVSQMLHVISSSGPYLVLYSGHDHTLEQISTALGLRNDPLLLRYASRIIFEIYQDNSDEGYEVKHAYFRILTNGRDVTKQIGFCKDIVTISKRIHLCKIEDIIRFLHEDYFTGFNVTNYKDACFHKTAH